MPDHSPICVVFFVDFQFNGYSKGSKVRQILADLALSQVANRRVEYLNISEKRRLAIGVQLVRESVMVLLDEPTLGLDPLDAYLLVSILSNYAKKTGCGILLSMEKPRSDVFPFLDRALFLCLGGVVYSGSTRKMLEYFVSIGFPCPELENPLMYYLCLSTVDRRWVIFDFSIILQSSCLHDSLCGSSPPDVLLKKTLDFLIA